MLPWNNIELTLQSIQNGKVPASTDISTAFQNLILSSAFLIHLIKQ